MKRRKFLADSFWPHAERLSFFVLLPALFAHGLATANLEGVPVLGLAGALVISTPLVAGLLVTVRRLVTDSGPAFTSVFRVAFVSTTM